MGKGEETRKHKNGMKRRNKKGEALRQERERHEREKS